MILSLVIKHDCTHIDTPPQKTYRYLPREKNCGITYKGQIMTKIVLTVGIPKFELNKMLISLSSPTTTWMRALFIVSEWV